MGRSVLGFLHTKSLHSPIDHLGHFLFHVPVSVDPVQGQFGRQVLSVFERSRHIDVIPAADVGIDLGKGLAPVVGSGFIKGLLDRKSVV